MPSPRIYQQVLLAEGMEICLDHTASHHLLHVLRVKLNTPVIIFNGQGGEYEAVISKLEKRSVSVRILKFCAVDRESPLKIHLAQGISRGEKMDFTLQKAVELGVTEITPLLTTRCGVLLSKERWQKRLQHWQSVIVSACEQCGRNELPTLHDVIELKTWISASRSDLKFILAPNGVDILPASINSSASIELMVGPEGGFSEEEISFANKYQFVSIKLGPRVLRTETAALVALSILQASAGDLV